VDLEPFARCGSNECYNDPMATTTTVRKIGNSYGVILGKDLLEQLGVGPGDALFVVRTDDGVRLTSFDPEFAEAIEAGRDYMKRHRDALRELAK
jgi:putative addiction module antidote